MKLKFYLLWFDDEKSWIDAKIDYVREIIEENGFEWVEPTICNKEEELDGSYDDYDIILMDYSLVYGRKEGKTGADIINKIRTEGSFTNILFYSQYNVSELRQQIAEKNLDGVFCSNREDFLENFEKLFLANIKKIEDVNNLRGLVMAETADLESIKNEIIEIYDNVSCTKKKEIIKKVLKKITELNKKQKEVIELKNENTPFKELMDLFDLYKKSYIVHKINTRESPICDFTLADFDRDIIKKRNLLAHVKEKNIEGASGKKIVLESEKNGEKLIFTQEEAKKIRKDISKYKKELETIKQSLESK
jgi:CheY-like chemotaxis protein